MVALGGGTLDSHDFWWSPLQPVSQNTGRLEDEFPPKTNGWNLKMKVWFRWVSLSKGWFSGSMLVFRGVNICFIVKPKLDPSQWIWIALPETNSLHLKIDGWNTSFLLGPGLFSEAFAVSFREGWFFFTSPSHSYMFFVALPPSHNNHDWSTNPTLTYHPPRNSRGPLWSGLINHLVSLNKAGYY